MSSEEVFARYLWQFPGDGNVSVERHFDDAHVPATYDAFTSVDPSEYTDLCMAVEFTRHVLQSIANHESETRVRLVLSRWAHENELPGPGDSVLLQEAVSAKLDVRLLALYVNNGDVKDATVRYNYAGFGFFHRHFPIVAGTALAALISYLLRRYGACSSMAMRLRFAIGQLLKQGKANSHIRVEEFVGAILLKGVPTRLQRARYLMSRSQQAAADRKMHFFAVTNGRDFMTVPDHQTRKIRLWHDHGKAELFLVHNLLTDSCFTVPLDFGDLVDIVTEKLRHCQDNVSGFFLENEDGTTTSLGLKDVENSLLESLTQLLEMTS